VHGTRRLLYSLRPPDKAFLHRSGRCAGRRGRGTCHDLREYVHDIIWLQHAQSAARGAVQVYIAQNARRSYELLAVELHFVREAHRVFALDGEALRI
jgi:hypothetical protein